MSKTGLSKTGLTRYLIWFVFADVKARVLNTAKWLTCVYRAMDEFENNADILEQLRKLPTIPLVGGMMISLAEKSVFFPPEADQQPKRRSEYTLAILCIDI